MVNRKRSKKNLRNKRGAGFMDDLKKMAKRVGDDDNANKELKEGAWAAFKAAAPESAKQASQVQEMMLLKKGGKRKTKISSLKARQVVANFFGAKNRGGKRKSSKRKNSNKRKRSKRRNRKKSKNRRKQKGGELSVFDGNMNNRTFGCRQPYWKPKCV